MLKNKIYILRTPFYSWTIKLSVLYIRHTACFHGSNFFLLCTMVVFLENHYHFLIFLFYLISRKGYGHPPKKSVLIYMPSCCFKWCPSMELEDKVERNVLLTIVHMEVKFLPNIICDRESGWVNIDRMYFFLGTVFFLSCEMDRTSFMILLMLGMWVCNCLTYFKWSEINPKAFILRLFNF